jgi:glycosyltransferase involved in cell wall biosynthesis
MILDNVETFRYSSSPNKFFDYISAGLPVIVNHPGWVADMLAEHDCGIYVEPGDSKGLAEAIIWMSKNEKRRRTMGANARKLAEARFDRDKLGERFVEVLELAANEFPYER